MMWLVKLVLGIAIAYAAVIAFMFFAQTWLLFPTWLTRSGGAELPASARRLSVDAAPGVTLAGVHIPAEGERSGDKALLLGFGGNAWDAEVLAAYLHRLFPDRDVVAFHYRGYPPSTGAPSARGITEDALAVYDHVADTLAPERIVAIGFSIGAGPAAYLGTHRPLAGMILVTPFDSLKALAGEHYPWAPVGLLLRHQMEIADWIGATQTPVALLAADADTIVPARRTEPLRRTGARIVLDRIIGGAGHNDLYDRPDFAAALRDALDLMETR